MVINPLTDAVSLTNINCRQVVVVSKTYKDINARISECLTTSGVHPPFAWEDHTLPGPIHPINDADALRVTVWDKNANCVWVSQR